jgi:hypothetical protein
LFLMDKIENPRMAVPSRGSRVRKHLTFSTLFLICGLALTAMASDQTPVTQWDRSSAMSAVRSVNIDAAVDEISNISSLADAETTLSKLRNIETRSDWPLPAREAAIYQFTRSLAVLPHDAVAMEVMQHLRNYQAQTLVPHEDHGDALIPLFNIRGAAAGVENSWQRAEFGAEARKLLQTNPRSLVSVYARSGNHNQVSAFLDAMWYADMADVVAVQNAVLQSLEEKPGLTPLLGVTTVITTDTVAIQKLLTNGRGAGLSSALVRLDEQLQPPETAALLAYAIQQAPASNATLAIAAWWPRLRHEAASRDLLVGLLADPALGGSAALALSQQPDIQTIKILQDIAGHDSDAARRAQMALDFNRAGLTGE